MIEEFIQQVFPQDSLELAWEILGDLITADRSIQKAICVVGEGGNGKSAFCQLCTNFVGERERRALEFAKARKRPLRAGEALRQTSQYLPRSTWLASRRQRCLQSHYWRRSHDW